jgi:hypothetical protein
MCALTTLEDFITQSNANKVFTIVMQKPQVTQATSFPEAKPKIILNIGCDHLAPSMAIIFSIHTLNLQRLVCSWKHGWQFEKDISIENNRYELNFFEEVFCYDPNFTTRWRYVLVVP